MPEPEGTQVIELAQQESRRSGHNFVAPEQILLGIIRLEKGLAFTALKDFDVTLNGARLEVSNIVPISIDSVAAEIPVFTKETKRVLESSWNEARLLGHNYIGSEHILLGLISHGENVATKILQNLRVDLTELRDCVLKLVVERDNPPGRK